MDPRALINALITPQLASRLCKELGYVCTRLKEPRAIQGYEGAAGTEITLALDCPAVVNGHGVPKTRWFVSPLGSHDVLIGLPWMQAHDVRVNCRQKTIEFLPGCTHGPADLQAYLLG